MALQESPRQQVSAGKTSASTSDAELGERLHRHNRIHSLGGDREIQDVSLRDRPSHQREGYDRPTSQSRKDKETRTGKSIKEVTPGGDERQEQNSEPPHAPVLQTTQGQICR